MSTEKEEELVNIAKGRMFDGLSWKEACGEMIQKGTITVKALKDFKINDGSDSLSLFYRRDFIQGVHDAAEVRSDIEVLARDILAINNEEAFAGKSS